MANSMKLSRLIGTDLEAEIAKTLPKLLPSLKVRKILREQRVGSAMIDIVADVLTPSGRDRKLFIEIKSFTAPSRIREALQQLKAALKIQVNGYPVLASTFIGSGTRTICKEEGVGYIDLAGNYYLQFDDFYLEKIVDKNPFPSRGRPPSLFTPISSRILRALLVEPDRQWKVSELAQTTQVSIGQTSNVTRRLIEEEYLSKIQKGRLWLIQPGKLLNAWQEQYSLSKNIQEIYYSFERNPEQIMARVASIGLERNWRYAITSFAAASLIAPFVRGVGMVTLYVDDAVSIEQWVSALDLRPAESGANIMILIPYDKGVFYQFQTVNGIILVSNVQLYLDLYNDPARGREQAEFLRKEKLGF